MGKLDNEDDDEDDIDDNELMMMTMKKGSMTERVHPWVESAGKDVALTHHAIVVNVIIIHITALLVKAVNRILSVQN